MICITEKMIAGGSCITRIDGKAVFVPFSLPGESLEIEITEDRKDYSFAKIVSILESSPHRVIPVCPLFGKCGGCTLQMADAGYQRELRLSILRDVLSRAHVECETEISIVAGESTEYRSRFQFHRSSDSIGFNAASSNTVIPVTDCPVAVPEIRSALKNGSLAQNRGNKKTDSRFHVFAYKGKLWNEEGGTGSSETGDSATWSCLPILGEMVKFDVRGFFQSNILMLESLLLSVFAEDSLTNKFRLLDFYSGVGTFSIFAASNFRETVLVEHNSDALSIARENLEARDIKTTLCAVNDEKWPEHPASRLFYDVAIIDPPRQGISKKAIEWFISSKIPDIRYVSCDSVTFARDASKLIYGGFSLKKVTLFDFYPQTHHIETLGIFTR